MDWLIGGFDYERWLFIQGIVAQGYVRPWPEPRLLSKAARYPVDRFRQRLAERIGAGTGRQSLHRE
ncbi:MAG: hypothetical protein R3F37_12125 [Candidatus Competibacteraceae bacterium]